MKMDLRVTTWRTTYRNLSPRQRIYFWAGVLFIGLCIGKFWLGSWNNFHLAPKPLFIHRANQIIVPAYSSLRQKMIMHKVKPFRFPHTFSIPGVVEANPIQTVNIFAPVTGRLLRLNVNVGDTVEQGQVLAVIRSPDLATAYADHAKALSQVKYGALAVKRAKAVHKVGANSVKDIELAENNFSQAMAELKRTEATLQALGKHNYQQLIIKAPYKGRVVALNYGRGGYVTDLTTPLLTMSNNDSVWVTANVPENVIGRIAPGQSAEIHLSAYPEQRWYGRVNFINPVLDPDTRRNKTRIVVENPDLRLQPNMFAMVKIAFPEPTLITIPTSALFMNDDVTSVYVEIAPWIFQRRPVVIGAEDNGYVRILSGLKSGERICVQGGIFVND